MALLLQDSRRGPSPRGLRGAESVENPSPGLGYLRATRGPYGRLSDKSGSLSLSRIQPGPWVNWAQTMREIQVQPASQVVWGRLSEPGAKESHRRRFSPASGQGRPSTSIAAFWIRHGMRPRPLSQPAHWNLGNGSELGAIGAVPVSPNVKRSRPRRSSKTLMERGLAAQPFPRIGLSPCFACVRVTGESVIWRQPCRQQERGRASASLSPMSCCRCLSIVNSDDRPESLQTGSSLRRSPKALLNPWYVSCTDRLSTTYLAIVPLEEQVRKAALPAAGCHL